MVVIRRVEGLSMVPSYTHGSLVVGWRFGKPKVGDVVIVKHHRLELIKRVDQLKNGHLYLLGDNPDESTDSRQFGWLPLSSVMAVVMGGRARG
ncbi:MAG TPA: S26 family signal peptidase [Magnetospirillaceae bacterium]|nr:S26 family signal peptidase [Magnetospirillaceae bacterium]